MSKPIDWTGVTDLYNRSAYDIKKDGTFVFPKHPKRDADEAKRALPVNFVS